MLQKLPIENLGKISHAPGRSHQQFLPAWPVKRLMIEMPSFIPATLMLSLFGSDYRMRTSASTWLN